ncbi:MAG: hypothetical protein WDO74_08280 [Pseudomonadota bacterium]
MSDSLTLGGVEALIASRRDEFIIGHEFMRRLEGDASLEALRRLLPRLAFFTFAFQDMLKFSRERSSDPVLLPMFCSLEEGDRGHDRWYVQDLDDVGIHLTAHEIFRAEHEVGRRVAYGLLALIEAAVSDYERLSLLLTLEAAAREFFVRVPGFAARAGLAHELRYFGTTHLAAEEAHDVFSADAQLTLNTIVVPAQHTRRVLDTVEKTFALMVQLAGDLAAAMAGPSLR